MFSNNHFSCIVIDEERDSCNSLPVVLKCMVPVTEYKAILIEYKYQYTVFVSENMEIDD